MIPRDNDTPNGSSFQDSDIPPLENTQSPSCHFQSHHNKGKAPLSQRSASPPPVLRLAPLETSPLSPEKLADAHLMAVDKVNDALFRKPYKEDCSDSFSDDNNDDEEEAEDGEDEEMSDEMKAVDDMMTLDQFQNVQRKDYLVRKNSIAPNDSHKKGRVDTGGSCSPDLPLYSPLVAPFPHGSFFHVCYYFYFSLVIHVCS